MWVRKKGTWERCEERYKVLFSRKREKKRKWELVASFNDIPDLWILPAPVSLSQSWTRVIKRGYIVSKCVHTNTSARKILNVHMENLHLCVSSAWLLKSFCTWPPRKFWYTSESQFVSRTFFELVWKPVGPGQGSRGSGFNARNHTTQKCSLFRTQHFWISPKCWIGPLLK